jgi:ERCC4-type nuclease
MTILLEIDYRERDIIQKFGEDIPFANKNLIIGDFIFRNDTDEIMLIVERKTIKDLCASIIDSRFREQKERLLESVKDPSKIVYILEGSKRINGKGTLSKTIMDSAIQNLIFKHQFKVLFSESLDDTVDQIKMLYKKLTETSFDLKFAPPQTLVKKSSKIIDNIYINQLSVIPGISLTIANKISEHYPSLFELVKAYMLSDSPESLLSEIKINEKRKLGKVLSKKIYECLIATTKQPQPQVQDQVQDQVQQEMQQEPINVKLDCVL